MSIHLYLSPHLDDAALSCGGHMLATLAAGIGAQVVNVFAGLPNYTRLSAYAQRQHASNGGADRIDMRKNLYGFGARTVRAAGHRCFWGIRIGAAVAPDARDQAASLRPSAARIAGLFDSNSATRGIRCANQRA